MSKSGKVSKVLFIDSYESKFGKMYNFAVLFEGDNQAYMMSGKKETPPVSVGEAVDYNEAENKESNDGFAHFTKVINGKQVDCIKISKEKQNNFGGGGGKSNWQPKSKEQYDNDIVGYVGGYAKDLLIARQDIAKGSVDQILVEYDKLVKGMTKSLQELTK